MCKPPRNSNTPPSPPKSLMGNPKRSYDPPVAISYEELGLFPRSFNRVLDRFFKQLFDDVENLVLEEYRFYRYLFLTTLKGLTFLFIVPVLVNVLSKHYVVRPLVEAYWNTQQTEVFLNRSEQVRAYRELRNFEETLYFDALTLDPSELAERWGPAQETKPGATNRWAMDAAYEALYAMVERANSIHPVHPMNEGNGINKNGSTTDTQLAEQLGNQARLSEPSGQTTQQQPQTVVPEVNSVHGMNAVNGMNPVQYWGSQAVQKKVLELAERYNERSIQAIATGLADVLSLLTVVLVLITRREEIDITKSFLFEVFFGLDDTHKSLVMLIATDFLVGYHSPTLWEAFFQFVFARYGLPHTQTVIFLLVASLPVLVDVLIKFLIFRHLNRLSPTTVAVYHALIESFDLYTCNSSGPPLTLTPPTVVKLVSGQ